MKTIRECVDFLGSKFRRNYPEHYHWFLSDVLLDIVEGYRRDNEAVPQKCGGDYHSTAYRPSTYDKVY